MLGELPCEAVTPSARGGRVPLTPDACPAWLRPLVDNVAAIPDAYRRRLPADVLAMITGKAASSFAAMRGNGPRSRCAGFVLGPGIRAGRRRCSRGCRPVGHRAGLDIAPPRRPGGVPRRCLRSHRRRSGGHRPARSARRNRHRPQSRLHPTGHHGADVHCAVTVSRRPGVGVLAGSRPGGRRQRGRNGDCGASSGARLHQPGQPADGVPRRPRPPLGRPGVSVERDAGLGIHRPGDLCGARRRRLGPALGHHRRA